MVLIVWMIFAFACAIIADSKGMNAILWFCIGLLFGIFALGVVLVLPSKDNNDV